MYSRWSEGGRFLSIGGPLTDSQVVVYLLLVVLYSPPAFIQYNENVSDTPVQTFSVILEVYTLFCTHRSRHAYIRALHLARRAARLVEVTV